MTIGKLRAAIRRTLRSYGIPVGEDAFEELVAIADHHAAEEVAAAVAEQETTSPLAAAPGVRRDAARSDRAARARSGSSGSA